MTLCAAFFQTLFNTELVRYTLYTGEPVITGLHAHQAPFHLLGLGLRRALLPPERLAGVGGRLGGRVLLPARRPAPRAPTSRAPSTSVALAVFAVCVLILLFGGKRIERTLELLNWVDGDRQSSVRSTVLCLRLRVARALARPRAASSASTPPTGSFRFMPDGADWFLIGAFAAFSAAAASRT